MATTKVPLIFGYKTVKKEQEIWHKEATLRESTAEDIIQASMESERVVNTEDGYQLVTSPTLVGLYSLCRQIVSIGDIKGPFTLEEISKLKPADLSLLQKSAEKLDKAAMEALVQRGRSDGECGEPGEGIDLGNEADK